MFAGLKLMSNYIIFVIKIQRTSYLFLEIFFKWNGTSTRYKDITRNNESSSMTEIHS